MHIVTIISDYTSIVVPAIYFYGLAKCSFVESSYQSHGNMTEVECVLEIRNGERKLCMLSFSSSNQTWVSSRQTLNPQTKKGDLELKLDSFLNYS